MKKWKNTGLLAVLLASVFGFNSDVPAQADGGDSVKIACLAPLSLVAGCVVGTPIAATRMTRRSFSSLMSALKDDNNSYKVWGGQCAILLAIPVGAIKGCYYGPKNAIVNCAKEPFSKDCFSLGEMP
jgi:hypothetical protein